VSPPAAPKPVRYGQVLRVRPERFEEYRRHHAAVWPEVLATITRCQIRNYSIYHKDNVLFAYFEYWGDDFAADMKRMAADPATRRWWALMEPMQDPLPTRAPGEWWARMEEVFHLD
jgi:L-rhamnose mutarotase